MREFFNKLNGWQRAFVLLALIWLPVFLFFNWGFPPSSADITGDFYGANIQAELKKILPPKEFNPDKYLANRAKVEAKELPVNADYIRANQGTKRAIFDKLIATDINYTSANEATKQAIRDRFGIKGVDLLNNPNERIVDPYVVEKVIKAINKILPPQEQASVYKMDDGAYIESQEYSEAEVKAGYAKARDELKDRDRVNFLKDLAFKAFVYFLPLGLIYLFCWLLAWVYRGFKR